MTRKECETQLAKKLWEMVGILKQYAPECKYLSAVYTEDEYCGRSIRINNENWGSDEDTPVDIHQAEKDLCYKIQRDCINGLFTVTQGDALLGRNLNYVELIEAIEMHEEGHSR